MNRTATTPPGCLEPVDHEREVTALASALQAQALEMLESDGRIDLATGKELALASIRARKVAADLAALRSQRDHDLHLLSEYKKLEGTRGMAQRPRLVRNAG